jgi:phosphatidylinositol glycan class N
MRLTPTQFLGIGAVFHLLFCYSIFDIYFTSPLVHGMQPVDPRSVVAPPASRLVLFIGTLQLAF